MPDREGHLCIGNGLLTDFETATYQVDRQVDAGLLFGGEIIWNSPVWRRPNLSRLWRMRSFCGNAEPSLQGRMPGQLFEGCPGSFLYFIFHTQPKERHQLALRFFQSCDQCFMALLHFVLLFVKLRADIKAIIQLFEQFVFHRHHLLVTQTYTTPSAEYQSEFQEVIQNVCRLPQFLLSRFSGFCFRPWQSGGPGRGYSSAGSLRF